MNDTPENLSAPKAEKPNRSQVLESLKTIQDFATHIKGQPLKPEQSFQLRVFEQTVNNTPLQNGVSQTENSFVSTETGQKFSQQEGIPLNELIQITTERLGTEGLSLEEQKKLMQHIDILRASSKSFMSFPERIDPDQYKARIEQEAAMMSKIPGETRSHQELLAEADRILKDRIELVLPDDEAKIQDGSNGEVDSSPVRPDQAMILRPDNPLVPITKSDEVDSSPVRPDQAMILRPDNPLVPITKSDEVDSSPVRPDQAMILRPDNFGVINEDTNDNEVDSSPVRPDQAMILRPNQEMILRPDGSMIKVEEAKFTTSITNATETVDNMSHLGARRDVTESLREKRWGWPIDWIRKTGVRWLEKYHVLRRGEKLREAMINNNTSQWTMAEVNGAAAKVNELRANGQLEQSKITERFNKGQLIGNESQFVATGELKKLIRTEIIANIVDNKIENPEQLRIALAKFVKDNLTNNTIVDFDGKDTVGQQLQQVFGADASQFGRIADYFATDLLEMGSNIRKHLAKHNQSLAEIDKQIEIKLGNARLANGGKNQDFVDRLISLSRKYQNPALEGTGKILAKSGVIFNPLGIGVAASLGYTAIMQGSSILAKKAMLPIILGTAGAATVATGGIAPLLVGATAAGAIAMNRRFWELGQDGMQHTADRSIIGEKITAKQETPKNLLQRFANDFLDLNRRESLNRRRYDTVSAINLIEGGGNDPSGNVRRSVSELRKLDISEGQEANRNEIARRIAEIQTRLDFNFDGQLTFNNHTINTRKAALIDYENSTEANTKPTDLLIEKNKLKDVLSRGGMNKEQIDLLIGAERVIMSKYFIRNIEQQNRAFMKYRLLNSAGAGVFGAGVGILGGLFAQEVVTAASRVAQPILENVVNNINTNPLLLWAMNTVRTISQGRTIRENLFNTGPSVEQQNTGITRQALRDLFSRPGTLQVDKDLYLNVDGNSEIRNASFSSIGNYAEAANENNISVDSTSRILKTPPLRVEGESIIMSGKPDLVNDPNVDPRIRELLKGWSTETNIPDSNESTIKYNVERELTDAISNNRVAGFAQGNLEVSVGDPANPSIRPDGQISLRLLRDHLEDPSIRMENGKVSPEFEDARKFAVHIFGKAQLIDGRPSVTIDPTLPGSPPYLGPDGQMTREWLDIKNELIKNQWNVNEVTVNGQTEIQINRPPNWELSPPTATKFVPREINPIGAPLSMEIPLIPVPFAPRHPLERMTDSFTETSYRGSLEGGPTLTERKYPHRKRKISTEELSPELFRTLSEEENDSWELIDAETESTLKEFKEAVINADQVYMVLPYHIGDALVTAGYVKALQKKMEKLGSTAKVNLVVPNSLFGVLKPLESGNLVIVAGGQTEPRIGIDTPHAKDKHDLNGLNTVTELIKADTSIKKPVILDFENLNGGDPEIIELTTPDKNVTTFSRLFQTTFAYGSNNYGNQRYQKFASHLLNDTDESEGIDLLKIPLPVDSEERYAAILERSRIKPDGEQITIVLESGSSGRQYDLDKWVKVAKSIQDKYPTANFNFVYNPYKPDGDATKVNAERLDQLIDENGLSRARFVIGSIEDMVSFFNKQSLILSNDGGMVHIAGATQDGPPVLGLYFNGFSNHWRIDADKVNAVEAPEGLADFAKEWGETDESKKWINKIDDKSVSSKAIELLSAIEGGTPTKKPKSRVVRIGRGVKRSAKKGYGKFNDSLNKGTEAIDRMFGTDSSKHSDSSLPTEAPPPSTTTTPPRVQRVYDVVTDRMNAGLAAVDRAFGKTDSTGTSSEESTELPIEPSSTVSSTDSGVQNTVDNTLNSGLEKVDDLRNSTESRSLPINDTVNQISSNVNALLNTGTERIDQVKANLEANLNSALSQINSVLTVGALNAISGIDYAFRPEVQEQLNRDILKLDADIQAKWQQLATLLAQMRAKKNNTAVTPPPIENNIPEELAVEKPQGTEITPTENISAEILTSEPKTTKFTLPELSTELPTELTQTDLPPEQINQLKQLLFLNNMVINLSQKPNYDGSDFVHLQTQIMQAMDRLGSNTNNSWSYSDKDGLTIKDKHYTAAEFNDLRNQFIDINFAKLPGGAKLENYRDMVVPRSFNIGNMWREFGAKSFFKNLGLAALQEQIKAEELRYAPAVLRWGDEVQQKWIIDKIQQNIPQI